MRFKISMVIEPTAYNPKDLYFYVESKNIKSAFLVASKKLIEMNSGQFLIDKIWQITNIEPDYCSLVKDIVATLSGKEWNSDTLPEIADMLRQAGLRIDDLN